MSGVGDGSEIVQRSHDFHHPYTPYDIQVSFMDTVYQVLDEGRVAILESPTGTVSIGSASTTRDT